jgi:pimeloyl-ACP methyl ester carboxylesterase
MSVRDRRPRVKDSLSEHVLIRGLRYHVRTWGSTDAPKLFMLHGWMDVSASFQFLVDALQHDWRVIAPDWRGFGLSQWCADGYWFADYIADLDALLQHFSVDEPARLVGHSLGGNAACLYAGVRPQRVARAISLDGFGLPAEASEAAPDKITRWLDALDDPAEFSPYASLGAVADRLQRNNRRLPRDKAEFLASHWAASEADGVTRLLSDPRHKLPFPTVYRAEEVTAIWRRVVAPVLWVAARDSFVTKWLGGEAEVLARLASLQNARLHTIEEAGHMLHHDQPERVAAAIESFLLS